MIISTRASLVLTRYKISIKKKQEKKKKRGGKEGSFENWFSNDTLEKGTMVETCPLILASRNADARSRCTCYTFPSPFQRSSKPA